MEELIENIDWELLSNQKLEILDLTMRLPRGDKSQNALEGVINLLDALEDKHLETL